ncbi:CPBP family intramembrane glutamic endopeptidase [Nocardia iowensis]|uniref:CPBP family intramembrane metalloprotease n=1 Tax=Nocardia iowensis TaxID=204891 RepID=A0ABX8RV14_NOCIO|nr:CPBP family intramembrane glutamic endopeptidase [Nocardia iowensis]QXN92250.1 CPBP family intramembrane metalloprotease [Nocardia iowensis]
MSRVPEVAVAVGIPLAWSNWLLPGLGLGVRGRTAANAGFATAYALVFDDDPNWFSARGFRYGIVSAALVAAGYGVALAIPPVREGLREFADRGPEVSDAEWIAVHIPIGTVYSEEMVFRAALDPLLDNAFGSRAGSLLGALTFGLWHIHPARAAGESVPATVAATAAGGFVLGWLRRRTGSVTAPALLHFATNAGGAIAPRLARLFGTPRTQA